MTSMTIFPTEINTHILSYLNWYEKINCALVCTSWKDILQDTLIENRIQFQKFKLSGLEKVGSDEEVFDKLQKFVQKIDFKGGCFECAIPVEKNALTISQVFHFLSIEILNEKVKTVIKRLKCFAPYNMKNSISLAPRTQSLNPDIDVKNEVKIIKFNLSFFKAKIELPQTLDHLKDKIERIVINKLCELETIAQECEDYSHRLSELNFI